eukprot:Partr_v1_DN27221_c3_g1_i2_m38832 putative Sodium hydrogen exchanger
MRRMKVKVIHESIIAILLGLICGIIIHYADGGKLQRLVTFDHRYFFNMLRPPMILNSGYELDVLRFYRNMGPILIFAFLGTFISSIVIGVLLYCVTLTSISGMILSFLQCLIFGAILSSTDPLTMLGIFRANNIDKTLHTVVFGESVLNNAVSIVLFNILYDFKSKVVSPTSLGYGFLLFCLIFIGSALIGIIMGMGTAYMLKVMELYRYPSIESCVVILLAYLSYIFSTAVGMSGIVSLLFTSITMKRYVYHNLSPRSRDTTTFFFKLLSYLAEMFIFIYLGISI